MGGVKEPRRRSLQLAAGHVALPMHGLVPVANAARAVELGHMPFCNELHLDKMVLAASLSYVDGPIFHFNILSGCSF